MRRGGYSKSPGSGARAGWLTGRPAYMTGRPAYVTGRPAGGASGGPVVEPGQKKIKKIHEIMNFKNLVGFTMIMLKIIVFK